MIDSFATILEAVAHELPDEVAISEPDLDYTYAEFENRAARLANLLDDAGVGPGDKVACYLYNGAAYLETVFAALKIGAVPINANYRYTHGELSSLLRDADTAALVFSSELSSNVAHAARHVPTLRLMVQAGSSSAEQSPSGAVDLERALRSTAPRPASPRPGTDQLFIYTGGTTGKPKGVVWRQADLLHSLLLAIFHPVGATEVPKTLEQAAQIAVTARTERRAPNTLPVVPLMHATGLFNSIGALLVGGKVITTQNGSLNPKHVWQTVAQQQASTLIVAGNAVSRPLIDELVAAEAAGRPHDVSSLRSVISSGATLSDMLKQALHERANITIIDVIASSEGGPFAFAVTSSSNDLPSRYFPAPGTKVIDELDRDIEVGADAVGILAYSGPMPLGYYKDAVRTGLTYRCINGVRYAMPGDLAHLNADGSLRFLGRGSGVINTGGEKVHPQEVEDVLLAHPQVTDAIVVGVADALWGERVCAVVASRDPSLNEGELQRTVRGKLAGYKVPRTVVVLPTLARTSTGKLEVSWAQRLIEDARAHSNTAGRSDGI